MSRRYFIKAGTIVTGAVILGQDTQCEPPLIRSGQDDVALLKDFSAAAREFPEIADLRRTVGCFGKSRAFGLGISGSASAVLLDQYGTVACSHHQAADDTAYMGFNPINDRKRHWAKIKKLTHDSQLDVSFWKLEDVGFIGRHKLRPVLWGKIGNFERMPYEQVVGIGCPKIKGYTLQAVTLITDAYFDSVEYDGRKTTCKIKNFGHLFQGCSGEGIFDVAVGHFLGIVTATYIPAHVSFFTPADAIYDAYVRSVPAAAKLRLQPLSLERRECDPAAPLRGAEIFPPRSPMDNRL